MPPGAHKLSALRAPLLHWVVVNCPPWPKTSSGITSIDGNRYSSARLLPVSAMYRTPALSISIPPGRHSVPELARFCAPWLHWPVVKLPACPNTWSAILSPEPGWPVLTSGVLYSSTRLFPVSDTYRFPELSTATPLGAHRLLALRPPLLQAVEKKSGCPITASAALPLVRAVTLSQTRTRLFAASATYMWLGTLLRSMAIPACERCKSRVDAVAKFNVP